MEFGLFSIRSCRHTKLFLDMTFFTFVQILLKVYYEVCFIYKCNVLKKFLTSTKEPFPAHKRQDKYQQIRFSSTMSGNVTFQLCSVKNSFINIFKSIERKILRLSLLKAGRGYLYFDMFHSKSEKSPKYCQFRGGHCLHLSRLFIAI